MGRMERKNVCWEIWTSLREDMRFVVRANTRVLIAYANCQHAQQVWGSTTHSEEEMPSDEEDGVPEVERVVDVVVVDDDPGREYDPDGDNHRR